MHASDAYNKKRLRDAARNHKSQNLTQFQKFAMSKPVSNTGPDSQELIDSLMALHSPQRNGREGNLPRQTQHVRAMPPAIPLERSRRVAFQDEEEEEEEEPPKPSRRAKRKLQVDDEEEDDMPKPTSRSNPQATAPLTLERSSTLPLSQPIVKPTEEGGADLEAKNVKGKRSQNFCFTLNNYCQEDEDFLRDLKDVKYMVYGREVAPSTGTKHLQGQIVWTTAKSFTATKALLGYRYHLEFTKVLQNSILYCQKGGDYVERGTKPKSAAEKGQMGHLGGPGGAAGGASGHLGGQAGREMERKRWQEIKLAAQEGRFEDVDPKVYILHLKNLEHVHYRTMRMQPLVNTFEVNEWFFGDSRTGKSRTAREAYPTAYIKMANKWFDGYLNQEVMILEDVDPDTCQRMAHYIKIWADHYPFPVEVKGGVVNIRPRKFIITSNYSIEECFPREKDIVPLMRRFRVTKFEWVENVVVTRVVHEPTQELPPVPTGAVRTFIPPPPARPPAAAGAAASAFEIDSSSDEEDSSSDDESQE